MHKSSQTDYNSLVETTQQQVAMCSSIIYSNCCSN